MRLPGVAYVALITVMIGWLQGDWFADQIWIPAAVIILGAIAKLIEVYLPSQQRAFEREVPRWRAVLFG